jgi:hypothetical protein
MEIVFESKVQAGDDCYRYRMFFLLFAFLFSRCSIPTNNSSY